MKKNVMFAIVYTIHFRSIKDQTMCLKWLYEYCKELGFSDTIVYCHARFYQETDTEMV